MALKFDFSKLRTAVAGFLTGTDTAGGSLAAGEEAVFVPKMRTAFIVENITAAITLTNEDSGKVFMLDSAGGAYQITLPVAANLEAGWNCKFIVKEDTPSNDITIAAGSAILDGVNDDGQGNVANSTAGTAVSNIIVEAASKQGDFIDLMTDGTTYYFHAVGSVDQAFTTS
tara:strand:+ start:26 stop:538 length:513 start_codon:yes stop_codon:yes gene_type:complete